MDRGIDLAKGVPLAGQQTQSHLMIEFVRGTVSRAHAVSFDRLCGGGEFAFLLLQQAFAERVKHAEVPDPFHRHADNPFLILDPDMMARYLSRFSDDVVRGSHGVGFFG
jgi:hypothetical protein